MFFKPYYLGCLAHASYLIGGDNGEAAVIDPRRDVEEYLADAASAGLAIKHIIETHIHADFVSGHVELSRRTGATIHIGHAARAVFEHDPVHDGDTVVMDDVTLTFLETPGHTPESVTVIASVAGCEAPRFSFTGDTLFIGDVGRPDLVGSKGYTPEAMSRLLYRSLLEKLLPLPDATEVWPAHGAGSACGRALSDDRVSTIGRERLTNVALRYVIEGDEAGFIQYATSGLAAAPEYFSHDAARNRGTAATIEEILAAAKPFTPHLVEELAEDAALVLDTRSIAGFGLAHVPGAIHIQLEGKFGPWVGALIPPDATLIVVTDEGFETETITRLARVGYERVLGWLDGGMAAWISAGGEVATVPQVQPSVLIGRSEPGGMLDVRTPGEWNEGHVDGATHIPLAELQARICEAPDGPLTVMCRSGYRSSIACSLLQRAGRSEVSNVGGGWSAWQAAEEAKSISA